MSPKSTPNEAPEPKKKRRHGPEPETLYIPPDKIEDTLDRLVGKKPMPPEPGKTRKPKPSR